MRGCPGTRPRGMSEANDAAGGEGARARDLPEPGQDPQAAAASR